MHVKMEDLQHLFRNGTHTRGCFNCFPAPSPPPPDNDASSPTGPRSSPAVPVLSKPSLLLALPNELISRIFSFATAQIAHSRGDCRLLSHNARHNRYCDLHYSVESLIFSLNSLGATKKLRAIAYETFFEQTTVVVIVRGAGRIGKRTIVDGALAVSEMGKARVKWLRFEVVIYGQDGAVGVAEAIKGILGQMQGLRGHGFVPRGRGAERLWPAVVEAMG